MIDFGIVGTGWRAEFYLRIARERPDLFRCLGVVTRDVAGKAPWALGFGVTLLDDVAELLALKPLFVVTSVRRDASPQLISRLAVLGVPVLSETPPANDLGQLAELFRLVEGGAKIAVAEQFHLQPHHAARIAFARSGKLGPIVQAQVSLCHGYHAMSLIRRLLGIGAKDVTVTARRFVSPMLAGRDRYAPPDREAIVDSTQVIATLDFGDQLAVYDFTDAQYHSDIRGQRVLVRGERGEIIDDTATYMQGHRTPITVEFLRSNAGERGNLEGLHLRGILAGENWLYVNPFVPARFSDEEIAIADCLLRMADYVSGAAPFYSLAEACQDRYLELLVAQSVSSGAAVRSEPQAWTTSLL